jgi:hypothetical protein
LGDRRSQILGDTVRLYGGRPDVTGLIDCALKLRLQLPGRIGDIELDVQHDPTEFELVSRKPGQQIAADSISFRDPGFVLIRNASRNGIWAPDEYELARFVFKLKNPSAKPLFHIAVGNAFITLNGQKKRLQTQDAFVYGS